MYACLHLSGCSCTANCVWFCWNWASNAKKSSRVTTCWSLERTKWVALSKSAASTFQTGISCGKNERHQQGSGICFQDFNRNFVLEMYVWREMDMKAQCFFLVKCWSHYVRVNLERQAGSLSAILGCECPTASRLLKQGGFNSPWQALGLWQLSAPSAFCAIKL